MPHSLYKTHLPTANKMWTSFNPSRLVTPLASNLLLISVLVLYGSFGLVGVTSFLQNGGDYGAGCMTNKDCDHNRFLECIDNECKCLKTAEMIWVANENACLIREGAPCQQDDSGVHRRPMCVPRASCIDGRCECGYDQYLPSGFGLCELGHGSVCTDHKKCAIRYLLECSEGNGRERRCRCRGEGTEFVWDDDKGKCVSTVGGPCDTVNFSRDDKLECIQNAECLTEKNQNRCRCKEGFEQTQEGTCMLPYGHKCNSSNGNFCNKKSFLICQDGKCSCEFYGQMMYDKNTKQCRWLAGEDCEDGGEDSSSDPELASVLHGRKCIVDAYCKLRPKSQKGVCTCHAGLEKSAAGKCTVYRGHGQLCTVSLDCDRDQFLECITDSEDGTGRCGCRQQEMHFDGTQCRVNPGKSCAENKQCARNAYCDGTWCICNQGYQIKETECVGLRRRLQDDHKSSSGQPPWMKFREDDVPQHPHSICSTTLVENGDVEWEKCKCLQKLDSHIWSTTNLSCLALVGSNCSRHDECVDNAVCDIDGQICQCSSEAHTTSNRTCIVKSHLSYSPNYREEMQTLKSVLSQDIQVESKSGAVFVFQRQSSFVICIATLRLLLHIIL